jgi:hypothetical protein
MNIAEDKFESVSMGMNRVVIVTTNTVQLLRIENGVIIAETMQRPHPMSEVQDWSQCDVCNGTTSGHYCDDHVSKHGS